MSIDSKRYCRRKSTEAERRLWLGHPRWLLRQWTEVHAAPSSESFRWMSVAADGVVTKARSCAIMRRVPCRQMTFHAKPLGGRLSWITQWQRLDRDIIGYRWTNSNNIIIAGEAEVLHYVSSNRKIKNKLTMSRVWTLKQFNENDFEWSMNMYLSSFEYQCCFFGRHILPWKVDYFSTCDISTRDSNTCDFHWSFFL